MYQTVNTDDDRIVFQSNITSLSTWATHGVCMSLSFNATKCSIIMYFNQKPFAPVVDYTLSEAILETRHENKYQSDLKFATPIKQKVARAKQQKGMIKRALHKAKLLAYSTLCRPLVE